MKTALPIIIGTVIGLLAADLMSHAQSQSTNQSTPRFQLYQMEYKANLSPEKAVFRIDTATGAASMYVSTQSSFGWISLPEVGKP
jgi:hypothetical protein